VERGSLHSSVAEKVDASAINTDAHYLRPWDSGATRTVWVHVRWLWVVSGYLGGVNPFQLLGSSNPCHLNVVNLAPS